MLKNVVTFAPDMETKLYNIDGKSKFQAVSIAPMHTAEHILNQTMVRMFGCPRSKNAHIERKKSKCDYCNNNCKYSFSHKTTSLKSMLSMERTSLFAHRLIRRCGNERAEKFY